MLVVGQRTGIVRFYGATKFAPGKFCLHLLPGTVMNSCLESSCRRYISSVCIFLSFVEKDGSSRGGVIRKAERTAC